MKSKGYEGRLEVIKLNCILVYSLDTAACPRHQQPEYDERGVVRAAAAAQEPQRPPQPRGGLGAELQQPRAAPRLRLQTHRPAPASTDGVRQHAAPVQGEVELLHLLGLQPLHQHPGGEVSRRQQSLARRRPQVDQPGLAVVSAAPGRHVTDVLRCSETRMGTKSVESAY